VRCTVSITLEIFTGINAKAATVSADDFDAEEIRIRGRRGAARARYLQHTKTRAKFAVNRCGKHEVVRALPLAPGRRTSGIARWRLRIIVVFGCHTK